MTEAEPRTETGRQGAPCFLFAAAFAGLSLSPLASSQEITFENPHRCRAHIAAAPLAGARVWMIDGDVRFRMAGVEVEASAQCDSPGDEAALGIVQLVLDYRVEARYASGKIEIRVASPPLLDALDASAPWYPARRQRGSAEVRLSMSDRPAGFVETDQAYVSRSKLERVGGHARFVTIVMFHDAEHRTFLPLDAIEWTSVFAAETGAEGDFRVVSGAPVILRTLDAGEYTRILKGVRIEGPLAIRKLEWWWVPAQAGEPPRRVAAMR